jgi:c-di-GMP-binding flagellar brake protein YcgR
LEVERRRFARIEVSMMLKFKTLEQFGDALDGSACDLSEGGICINSARVKPVGTRVEIELPVPGAEPVSIRGTVRSIRYKNGQPEKMGIEFDELEGPAKSLIQHFIRNQGRKSS